MTPGQYFILTFDLSTINRGPHSDQSLEDSFTLAFKRFYQSYSIYGSSDVSKLYNLIHPEDPALSLQECAMWVNTLLETAQKSGDKQFADVQVVRIDYSRISLT